MLFNYFGITTFKYVDAFFSGIIIGGGSNVVHDLYETIVNYKEQAQLKTEEKMLEIRGRVK